MKRIKAYKVEYFGGPLNGAERHYKDLSVAIRVAKSYVTRCRIYPDNVGFWIWEVYDDYTKRRIMSESD